MGRKGLPVFLFIGCVLMPARAMHGQNFEASGNGGFGVAERDGFGIRSVPSGGATLSWRFTSRQKLQFDYTFGHIERETASQGGNAPSIHNRHFFTGSYVLQPRQGRNRPFVQIGVGVQHETNNDNEVINRDLYDESRTGFAGIVGAGITIELGRGAFIRPQVRAYLAQGANRTVNVTALPSLGFGWQF